MRISAIVALAANRVIGCDGRLPWHLPSDLQRFKRLTMGHALLMGRHTFESIGRPLPGRRTILLSRQPTFSAAGCEVAKDLQSALKMGEDAEELFICGGAEVYRQTLPLVQRIYLTELEQEFPGDAYFPEIPATDFREVHREYVADQINYWFCILKRRL
jgi:dihydrofolate reductase